MKRKVNSGFAKRGLSPVIASLFLIVLVLVSASLIYLWARGFVSEQIEKRGQPVENLCASVEFEVELLPLAGFARSLEVVNRGNIDIYTLDLKMFDSEGNTEVGKFKFTVDAGASKVGEVDLRMQDGKNPERVIVYPALIGTVKDKPVNKVFTCNDMGKTLIL
jgi:hypothetical protein